jgi:uncharacterized membrane-anchored protein YhcB (DUF1043 family)
MTQRIAAAMSLVAFAVCLLVGLQIGNPFGTVVARALLAMMMTMVIGLIIGAMATRMLEDNLKIEQEKLKNGSAPPQENGR